MQNDRIVEFYDYLRYAISMAQNNLPVVVIEDIKNHIANYINGMSEEELENVSKTLELYEEFYIKSYNVITFLKTSVEENPYNEEISSVFKEELGDLSIGFERLDFVRDFIANIIDMIDARTNSFKEAKKRV